MSDFEDDTPPVLLPCTICSRTFRPEVLERHTKICEKASQKKRRPFDSFKSRVSGTELEEFLGPATLPGQPVKRPEKSPVKKPVHSTPKWKETHETLIATLRAARGETDNNVNLNLNKHAGSEQCPSCGRYFGPRAFDRHVEFCKEKTSRIKTTPSKGSQAHERLEARIKYRAPLSLKPKLTTKEKYSPMLPRKADSSELCTPTKSTPVNFAVKTPKPVPMKASPSPNQNHFSRQSPTRTSQRQRSVSPTKKSGVNNCRISANKTDPVIRQTNTPKIKDHLKGNEDLRPKMTGKLTAQDKIRNFKCRVPRSEESCPISYARGNRVKHSDEETEEIKIKNLKATSSRPIFQTELARKYRPSKKPDEFSSSSSEDETLSLKSVSSSKGFPEREFCKKNTKRWPLLNDSSANDESYGIYVSSCSFGIKPPPPRYLLPTPRKRNPGKKIAGSKNSESSSPVRREEISQEIKSNEKTPISKIPKPTSDHVKWNKADKMKETKPPDVVDLSKKDRERTATIKKKHRGNLSEVSNQDLENIFNELDHFDLRFPYSKGNKEFGDSEVWEVAGEEFLKEDRRRISDLDRGPESKNQDEIIVLHVTDPSKLSEQDTDPKLCMSEPCLSPSPKKKGLSIPSGVMVFTAAAEPKIAKAKKMKRIRKKIKARLPRGCHVREKTFLANGCSQIKKRKLNSDEPARVNLDFFPEIKNQEIKYEYFEISSDLRDRNSLSSPGKSNLTLGRCDPSPEKEEFEKMPELTNNSLENIEEEEEEEEFSKCIEIEDFILSKPNKEKILFQGEKYLEELFPKPKQISECLNKSESSTAVRLSYVVDSVFDFKSEEKKFLKKKKRSPKVAERLPEITSREPEERGKENSIMSLVEIWKNRKGNLKGRDTSKEIKKPRKKVVKLAPIGNKNRLQIAVLPFVLRRKIAEVFVQIGCLEREKKDESYDPFKQAEQQMMALLSWPSTVDLKANKETSNPPSRPRLSPSRNLQTSPTSAFTKYPNKDGKTRKDINENLNRTKVEIEKEDDHGRTYTAADDWEQIFEKHFDLNKNDVSEKTTKSVKSALDGLLKKSPRKTDLSTFSSSAADKSKTDGSLITDMIYTSTPKSVNSDSVKKFRSPESKPKTPSTYRKITGDVYGRISPPDDFGDSLGKENLGNKSNRNSGISLSSLSFSSQVSDTTIADDEVSRNNLEIIGVATPRSGRRKFARSQSVFDERNKMLFAKTLDRNFSSSDENDLDQSLPNILKKNLERKNPPPTSSPFRFPRSQSVAEDRRKGDGDHSDEGDNVSSPETNKNRKAKMSGDSAYSSLNRKSPRPNILPLNQHNDDRLSSSGSENSLPPLNNDHSFKPKSLDFDSLSGKKNQPFKMSKFCHECGSKYPVPIAKFCCECGVRRLII